MNSKCDEEWDIYIVSKFLSTKILTNYKKKKKRVTSEANPGRCHLTQVIKVNTISNRTNKNPCSLTDCNEKDTAMSILGEAVGGLGAAGTGGV